jgi:hypothetical protein
MNTYDVTENKEDLHLLDNAEPNLLSFNAANETYEFPDMDVIELYQGNKVIRVGRLDVLALARHFDLIQSGDERQHDIDLLMADCNRLRAELDEANGVIR